MSVYSKEKPDFLRQSLKSLENQTLKASEIILVEDGPINEELRAVIDQYRNSLNIKSVLLKDNKGLAYALNEGLLHCSFELVARMDTDDIAVPSRFLSQLRYMVESPHLAVSSGWVEEFDGDGFRFIRKLPENHQELLKFAQYRSPIAHPASMFRRSSIIQAGGYPLLRKGQDYALWAKVLKSGLKVGNMQEVVVKMRVRRLFDSGRGLDQLRSEWDMFVFQKRIGFIGYRRFLINFSLRVVLRISPRFLKKFLYVNFR